MFVPVYANILAKVVVLFGVISRVGYLHLHLHTTLFVTPQLRISELPRLIWLSGLNRASKINVGLEPGSGLWFRLVLGSGFKIRPFYNSLWVCMQRPTMGD